MKIFALETNEAKAKAPFIGAGEKEMFSVKFHGFLFVMRLIGQMFVALLLVGIGIAAVLLGLPWPWVTGVLLLVWLWASFPHVLRGYIDWRYDTILVTDRKVVIINQSSIFHVEVRQMSLDNFASVNASTQFLNIFPFGMLCFDLKEGTGQRVCLKYVPNADRIASMLSGCVECFARTGSGDPHATHAHAAPAPAETPPAAA